MEFAPLKEETFVFKLEDMTLFKNQLLLLNGDGVAFYAVLIWLSKQKSEKYILK